MLYVDAGGGVVAGGGLAPHVPDEYGDAVFWTGVANCTRWAKAGDNAQIQDIATRPHKIFAVFTSVPLCSCGEEALHEKRADERTGSIPMPFHGVKSGSGRNATGCPGGGCLAGLGDMGHVW